MKFKKKIIALLMVGSMILLNLPTIPTTAADNNLIIEVGEKTTFDEGTNIKASRNLPSQQFYYLSEKSSSVAQYNEIRGNSYEGYVLPTYAQLSNEYKAALEASGYVVPDSGLITWVVERKDNRTVSEETIGMDGPETYYRDFPVYKIYPYRQYDVSIDSNIANGSIVADKSKAINGETVTLTIAPKYGYQFENISVKDENNNDITLLGSGDTRTFIMPEVNVSVTGSFSKIPPTVNTITIAPMVITMHKGDIENFTATVSGTYEPNTNVTWTVEGANSSNTTISGSGELKVASDETALNLTVRATSVQDAAMSSVVNVAVIRANIIQSAESNKITGIEEGDSYIVGTDITFEATGNSMDNTSPISGDVRYVPVSWSVNTNGTWTSAPYTATFKINNEGNYTLKVVYQKQNYDGDSWVDVEGDTDTKTVSVTGSFPKNNVEVDSSIANGSIKADKTDAISGETVTLTITPSDKYQLESIKVKDGDNNDITLSGTGNTRTFTMPEANVLVTGSFSRISYNVEVDSNIANGSIGADKISAIDGEIVTLTIAPSDKYQLESITVKDGNNNTITLSGTGNTRTFTMPESNVSVTGSFSKIPPTVDNVVLTPETAVVQKGEIQAFTAIVNGSNNPEQSVKWSVEGASSNDTTISESGVLKVSSDEMSSTLKVRATSTLDNTKSSAAVVKVIRANVIPDTTSNTISGIKEGASYIVGTEISFAATGGGMDNTSPISGDVRYVPISWSVNPHGDWTIAPYSAKFIINNVGNYTLKVLYQMQTFNGTSWQNIADEIDTKAVSFSTINKQGSNESTTGNSNTKDNSVVNAPKSGDQASVLFLLCVAMIAVASAGYMHLNKKRSIKK